MNDGINCIILCGGKGSRMNSPSRHKVCFEIDGVPAINRIISNFRGSGIQKFVVIVGSMAGQVVECVGSAYEDVAFVFQKTPLGTGDAAKKGINYLMSMDIKGPVLITMGDKLISPDVINLITDRFLESGLDAAVAVQPIEYNRSGGRIVFDEAGRLRGICESIDAKSALLYKNIIGTCIKAQNDKRTVDIDPFITFSESLIPSSKKRDIVLSEINSITGGEKVFDPSKLLSGLDNDKQYIKLGDRRFDPEYVEGTEYANAAIYLFKPDALNYAINMLTSDNVQKEIYLTDVVNILSNTLEGSSFRYKVSAIPLEDRNSVMTFNNAEELLEVENYFRTMKEKREGIFDLPSSVLKTVREWLILFKNSERSLMDRLREIYGESPDLIEERREAYIKTLNLFKEKYGSDRKVVISRAPGRANLMGRHVEHRGGHINVISINKEVIAVASPRNDDTINISNINPEFPDRSFSISHHLVNLNWKDWVSYIEADEIKKMVTDYQGDWMNYVKAPVLRLQYSHKDRKLTGMDMAFCGNIPMAAGLSSSSAIVVATAEACVALNNLDVTPQGLVDLCGEGEWFVGSRGGAGDHAAMKFGSSGYIAHIGFFPFSFQETFKFPEKYKLIIANSLIKAQKTTNAKDTFNQRVASYEFGLMMMKENFPQYKPLLKHLRDLNPDTLSVPPSKIYKMLLTLPEKIRPDELFEKLPVEYHSRIRQIMSSHSTPFHYIIRSVVLYGISECQRARVCKDLLKTGSLAEFGRLMDISHDGDRVSSYDEGFNVKEFDWTVPDSSLKKLIQDLRSEDPRRVSSAQIEMQPGGYGCSTPEIDLIVDISRKVPGVIGSQLSGAGLGGCVMILVKEDSVDHLISELDKRYYTPSGKEPSITVCTPVKGSLILDI